MTTEWWPDGAGRQGTGHVLGGWLGQRHGGEAVQLSFRLPILAKPMGLSNYIKFRQISTSLDKSSLHIPFQEPVISSRSILKLELVSILKKSSLGRPLREAHGGSWWNSSERSWSHLEIGELSELHEAGCTDGLTMKYHEMGSSSWDSIDSMSLLRCAIDIPLIDIILIHLVAINWFNWWCPTPNPDPGIPRARPRQGQLQ